MKEKLLNKIFVLVLAILIAHISASIFHIYWLFWWADWIMHLLGGFWLALAIVWLFYFSGYIKYKSRSDRDFFILIIFGTFIVGILWEFYEYFFSALYSPEGYWQDTYIDIILGLFGALFGYYYLRNKIIHRSIGK